MHQFHLIFTIILLLSIKQSFMNKNTFDENAQCSIEKESVCQESDPKQKYKKGK